MSIVEVIKQMANDSNNAQAPVNIVIGKVTKIAPIEIEVTQKLKLTNDFLILTERVTKYENGIIVREGLKVGDSVVLLRVQGGQQYVVLDKVVD